MESRSNLNLLTVRNTPQRSVVSIPSDVWFGISIFHLTCADLGGWRRRYESKSVRSDESNSKIINLELI